jgi:ubiquinone/menaquinone biosynthesis C-methylase UbiE
MKQVDRAHYDFSHYAHLGRFVSYYYQLKEVLKLKPESILEIGVGDRVFAAYVTNNTNIKYQSVDVAEDLTPDILGSVTQLPLPDNSFDVSVAFEVLEHLPFAQFDQSVSEMMRVAKSHVLISVPHFGPSIELWFKIPFLSRFKWAAKIPYHPAHDFNGEHYWEVGKKGTELPVVLEALKKHGRLIKHFVPFENQYHHFFILAKN